MFEFDEKIEVCDCDDFRYKQIANFICDTTKLSGLCYSKKYLVRDKKGCIRDYAFARKIEPKVQVTMSCDNGIVIRLIPKELADKIIAGDV